MAASATVFGLAFDREAALAAMHQGVAHQGEPRRVRLTLDEAGKFAAASAPLGAAPASWAYAISARRVESGDILLRHKTTWRAMFDEEAARAAKIDGADEVIFLNERGEITEGSRSTVFVRRNGVLATPPLDAGLLDGILRREMLETGACVERSLQPDDLQDAEEVYFGNSLRGLIRAVPARLALSQAGAG
jgi:para-aminobenzoate synthetase/4-amino-4-deoxychorismate lyase